MTRAALDRLYLSRACELAERGLGNTSPNPPVGAVVVRDGRTLGEGFHHRAGEPHAEVEALRAVARGGGDARGATLYVSLEPCDHHGRTPPCTAAVIEAGIRRIVIGTTDPNPKTAAAGLRRLREAGRETEVFDDPWALRLIEAFAVAIRSPRPYLTLKLASSLDGYVAPRPGARHWLTGETARAYVRDLRSAHDAVMVGAGTVRIDDPQLTVRPHRSRRVPYTRVVVCERDPVPASCRVFASPADGGPAAYRRTIVLAPAGSSERFAALEHVAEVLYVGEPDSRNLDLARALIALRDAGIASVLCEGGPTLAARLLEHDLVDRLEWLIAPALLCNAAAVPTLAVADVRRYANGWRFDRVERLGDDLLVSAPLAPVAALAARGREEPARV